MGMKRLYYLLLLLLFVCCKPEKTTTPTNNDPIMPNVSSIGESDKIEIVTWNIKYFPKKDFSDDYVKTIIEIWMQIFMFCRKSNQGVSLLRCWVKWMIIII